MFTFEYCGSGCNCHRKGTHSLLARCCNQGDHLSNSWRAKDESNLKSLHISDGHTRNLQTTSHFDMDDTLKGRDIG